MTPTAPADRTATQPRLLDATTLRERLSHGDTPRILDVRTPAEFETAHIPGSYNVPLDTLREHRAELRRHLDEDVVLVCRSGARAAQAEQALAAAGLPGVRVLEGGMVRWDAEGGPLSRGRATWELERQVRLVAGGLVAASIAGSAVLPRLKWVAGGVGAGLTLAAATDTCMMGMLLSRLPWNRAAEPCDVDEIVRALAEPKEA
jgi:rhodanese-related sulfurtransferase